MMISAINDTINYAFNPNNRGEIIFQLILLILGIVLAWLLAIFCKPVHRFIINVGKWWNTYRINPDLEMEIRISGNMSPIAPHDFISKMQEVLSDISSSSITHHADDSFKFIKNFNSFDGNITISPSFLTQGSYNFLFIKLRTKNIKLKNVKSGLGEIQIYLFRDVVGAINQVLRSNAERNNEEISVPLKELPAIFRLTAELDIEDITSSEDGIRITFNKDNISINGSIEPRTIEKIESIIRSNLVS